MSLFYVPIKLQKTREAVTEKHGKKPFELKMIDEAKQKQLVDSLVHLKSWQIEIRAYALSDQELDMVAAYIPHNYYDVEIENLVRVFSIRSNDRLCGILYEQWQHSYQKVSANHSICKILKNSDGLKTYFRHMHIEPETFISIIESGNIPGGILTEAYHCVELNQLTLPDKLLYYGIKDGTRLYDACTVLSYIYCEKQDYLNVSCAELLEIIKTYIKQRQKEFLKNFLLKMELEELRAFEEIANYFYSLVEEYTFQQEGNESYFQGFSPSLIQKYVNWINMYKNHED